LLRNAPDVLALGPPADVGLDLIRYMCERIGVADLSGLEVLDFGCGTRFTDSILNRGVTLRSYTGIENEAAVVDFLNANVRDPRLSFYHLDARNPANNPNGSPLTVAHAPSRGKQAVRCHLHVLCDHTSDPEVAQAIFQILRRHIKRTGQLFFSVTPENVEGYVEVFPDRPTATAFIRVLFCSRS
jgi:SAM-dependent methyltransferase